MASQTRKHIITIDILVDISKIKANQTMTFVQLTDYNMRNIFFKTHTQNVVEVFFLDPILKNQNLACVWINSLKTYKVHFCFRSKSGSTKIY